MPPPASPKKRKTSVHSFILSSCTTICKTVYICHPNNGRDVLGGLRYSFIDIDASKEEEGTTFLYYAILFSQRTGVPE